MNLDIAPLNGYTNTFFAIIIELFFILIFICYRLFYNIIYLKDLNALIKNIIVDTICIYNFFFSYVLFSLFNILDCTSFINGNYMTRYMIEECAQYNDFYTTMVFSFVLPIFFAFFIILPLMIFIFMNFKTNLKTHEVFFFSGYFLSGFRSSKFYWYKFILINLIFFF